MSAFSLILEAGPDSRVELEQFVRRQPGRVAVLFQNWNPLAQSFSSSDCYTVSGVVPVDSPLYKKAFVSAYMFHRGLVRSLSAFQHRGVPLIADLNATVGHARESNHIMTYAIRELFLRGYDHVVLALKEYSKYNLGILREARYLGLTGNESGPWRYRDGRLTPFPELLIADETGRFLSDFSRHQQEAGSAAESDHDGVSTDRIEIMALVTSSSPLYVSNAAPILKELRSRPLKALILTHASAITAELEKHGIRAESLVTPEKQRGVDQGEILDSLERFLKAYHSLIERREKRVASAGVPDLGRHSQLFLHAASFIEDAYWGLARYCGEVQILDQIFEQRSPHTVYHVPVESPLSWALHYLCRRRQIRTVTSVFASVTHERHHFASFNTDYVTLLGSSQKRAFQKRGYASTHLLSAGQPELDENANLWTRELSQTYVKSQLPEFNPAKKCIVVATSCIDPSGEKVWLRELVGQALRDGDVQVLCKLHPDVESPHVWDLAKEMGEGSLLVTRDRNIYPYLRVADLVLTDVSHAGSMSIFMRKLLLVVNFGGSPFSYNRYDEEGVAQLATESRDLAAKVRTLLELKEPGGALGKRYDEYIARNFTSDDGRSVHRVVDFLSNVEESVKRI